MPIILLLGSGRDTYREYLLASVSAGYCVVFADNAPATWQRRYVKSSHVVDTDDVDAVLAVARAESVDGVLTWMESCVETAAVVSMELGLPGHPPMAAQASRDKHRMRQVWAGAGVPSAGSRLVADLTQAREAAAAVGYPVVVKPRALAASVGVTLAARSAELDHAYAVAAGAELDRYERAISGVLVEEYLDGTEVSVESIVQDGEVHIVTVTDKQTGMPPGFEELSHLISAREQRAKVAEVRDAVVSGHDALGLRDGATHAEVRLTRSGPKLVELAARLAGDLIPRLVHLATGVDLGRAAAAVSVGERPELRPTLTRAAGIAFRYPECSGRVVSLGPATVPDGVVELLWTARPGAEVVLPPDGFIARLGHAIAVAPDAGRCAALLREARAGMAAVVEPRGVGRAGSLVTEAAAGGTS